MTSLVCPQCGERTSVTANEPAPESPCPRCGATRARVESEYSAHYYYQYAGELAAGGDNAGALQIVEQGLRDHDVAELHLLAAILCRRLGAADEMRRHVAAIPVDDSLRSEAEWLLRSQPAMSPGVAPPPDPALAALLTPSSAVHPPPQLPQRKRRWLTPLLAVLAISLAWFLTRLDMPADLAQPPQSTVDGSNLGVVADDAAVIVEPETPVPGPRELVDETAPAGAATVDVPSIDAESVATPDALPGALPTATVPPDLVRQTLTPEPLAAAGEAGPSAAAYFDLPAYLTELGGTDLVDLDVTAQLEGDDLLLTGYVETFIEREQLIALTEVVPGIEAVNAAELYIRPPATYTVVEGDSLWSITYSVYGDVARMQEVYELNRDVMASPESLTIGMTLKLPPYD